MASEYMKQQPGDTKRFNLVLPDEQYADVVKYAESEDMTVTEAIRHLLKIALYVELVNVYTEDGSGGYREIVFI